MEPNLAHPHALRATFYEAKRAFAAGATVIVTERPEGPERLVYPQTTKHSLNTTTWDELAGLVREFRNRYPRQTFYIVQPTKDQA
jgi:hypothetical protein